MPRRMVIFAALLLMAGCSRDPLQKAAQTMGATELKTIQYEGTGSIYALGQSFNPTSPWPRFNLKSYSRVVDYENRASQESLVRTQAEDPPRGGGNQPVIGEQQQGFAVSGSYAWNPPNNTPAPGAAEERQLQIWLTPHGFLKAAAAAHATSSTRSQGGREVTTLSFTALDKYRITGTINDQGLVETVRTEIPNPVLGDMPVEIAYSDYRDYSGIKFPGRIQMKQGGFPTLDLTVSKVQANVNAAVQPPDAVKQASAPQVRVVTQPLAKGVWFLGGGSHNSVAVEFKDFVAVVDAPLDENRSRAVLQEVKKLVPAKPVKYVINTHHHFDHSGGLRTYVAEGATVVTQEINRPFFERVFQLPHTLLPDSLAQHPRPASLETFTEKHVISDGTRTMNLYLIKGSLHNEGIIMAHLPKERILIEADVFTPPPPEAPAPAPAATLNAKNLYENLQQLKLNVATIAPIHGRVVTYADLRKFIGI